jgi:hypothetical protein
MTIRLANINVDINTNRTLEYVIYDSIHSDNAIVLDNSKLSVFYFRRTLSPKTRIEYYKIINIP